ncbi:MAG: ABC transporter [Gammaproteobacteria bacterium RBG_16_51_14]|nr:MAG: ABC transporter [Gammaproteobacteria bacterium RBG_16_51_14]
MKALEIRNLQKTYKNGHVALKGIDLTINQGEFFALLGPNGAGKSTTIGIICSLVNKSGGSVSVFGNDIVTMSAKAKSSLGIVPQEINFSQFETCLEIVLNQGGYYGVNRKLAHERAEKYLNKLGLWEKRNDVSRTLSGGLKRRLMIARAMIHEPKMLILDEPTAGVDVELRRSMWNFLTEINSRGITILLTTHYLEEAECLCRNIAIIDGGMIIENTTMKQLLSKLNRETLVLDLTTTIDGIPEIDGYPIRKIDPHTIEVDITRQQGINHLFELLTENNIRVCSMRNKSSRLEELFINLLENNNRD